jgi:D-alanyl-D-alanine carboxypeptidase (penicillin-binding protein 5/6)
MPEQSKKDQIMLNLFRLLIFAIIVLVIGVNASFKVESKNLTASLIMPGATWLETRLIPESPFPLQAKAGIVVERDSGKILYQRNPHEQLPIASLTKLMTALVADYDKDLFYRMLVASDNEAAEALAKEDTIERMNQRAWELGLVKTRFVDTSGLDPGNVSTPYELVKIVEEVLKNPTLVKILGTEKYKNLKNTNELLDLPNVIAGKTGYTDEAGQCLVLITKKLITVVLNAEDRFEESKKLIELLER